MVPSIFVPLEAMPHTPGGKIDRLVLPAPGTDAPKLEHEYVAPRSQKEAHIAAIFKTVLGVERVGIHDDFFDLGGHSLLATRAVNQIRDQLTVEFPLRSFFELPTVAGVAEYLSSIDSADELERLQRVVAHVSQMSDSEARRRIGEFERPRSMSAPTISSSKPSA